MEFVTLQPLWWLIVLVVPAAAFAWSLVQRRPALRAAAFALRCAGIVLVMLAMCRPFMRRQTSDAHIVFLLDVSESVDLQAARDALDRIRRHTEALDDGNSWSLLAVGAGRRAVAPNALAAEMERWSKGIADDAFRSASRLCEALGGARLGVPSGKAARVVLYSDGRPTDGALSESVAALRGEGIDIRAVPLAGLAVPEASVVSVDPSATTAHMGQRVRLDVTVSSNRDMPAVLRLVHRGVVEREIPVELRADRENVFRCDAPMSTAGANLWQVEVVAEKDHFPVNNAAGCTINVKGRARVLAVHRKPRRLRDLKRALSKQHIELEVRGEHGLPRSLPGLLQFDAIILADVPATTLTTRQMLAVQSYVTDFGGGLVMLGSENSFGLGGYYKTPIEEVLPIVSRYEKEKQRPSLAMVLVIDKSGSMSGVPIQLARQAARAAVELLSPRDQIAVIAFDGQPLVVCEMTPATDAGSVQAAIDRIGSGGGTNMYPAMRQGNEMLRTANARIRHMIVLSDGQSMPGPFQQLAGQMADESMTVSTVALGAGADRGLMQAIARIGRGRYYETLDAATVPRIFTKETVEASRSAIRETPFTPVRIGSADLLEGIDFGVAPYLLGYVMTRAKPTARMQLITENGDPLLALGRYGLGNAAAFTSDASDRWAGEWLHWRGFGKLWAQILRAVVRKADESGICVRCAREGRQLRYIIRRRDEAGRPVNTADWSAMRLDDDGHVTTLPVRQIGWGLYEMRTNRPTGGGFTLRLRDAAADKLKVLHYRRGYPAEYRLAARPDATFAKLPRLQGDDVLAELSPADTRRSLRTPLLLAGIACWLAGIFLRRV
ncbi:MAG: VWA domain-containing protein [Phycisphaerae bacterium]|nr:VWA domain-containing protein [Phycisphaerae bacterium]